MPDTALPTHTATEQCRACKGKGGAYESTGRGARLWWDCDLCQGTGSQMVLLIRRREPV